MKKIKILSVLVAVSFVFNVADSVFAAVGNISDKNSPQGALQSEFSSVKEIMKSSNTFQQYLPPNTTKFDDGKIISFDEYEGRLFARVESRSGKGSFRLEITDNTEEGKNLKKLYSDMKEGNISKEDVAIELENIEIKKTGNNVPEKTRDGRYVIKDSADGIDYKINSVNIGGKQYKAEGIKRENDKYYISFSVEQGQKQFWVEVTKEEDKNEIDAYDRKDLGLYVDIPKGAEAKEGIVSKYTTIYNPDSYSPTHHASDINVNGLAVTDIHKETVKVPTGRSPIEKEMYVGMVTTETGRNIYVEVPEEYVGKNITASINISDQKYVDYCRGEKDKHIISKENVKFDVNTNETVNTNTYSSIGVAKNKKGEPAYLQIKKGKGAVVKENKKEISNSQINSLKKYFNENLKNKDITSKEAKNALNNLKKNANDIIKGNTYSKVNVLKSNKGEPEYLQIKNKKGEVLAKIDIKGMNNKQINSLKKYFNTNLKNESKNSKEAKSALNILNKKANEIKKANSKEEKNKKKNKITDLLKKFFPNF